MAFKPVNMKWQLLLGILPGVEFYMFYRIKKLRLYLLIVLLGIAFGVGMSIEYALTGNVFSMNSDGPLTVEEWNDSFASTSYLITQSIILVVNLSLNYHWSKKWNASFIN